MQASIIDRNKVIIVESILIMKMQKLDLNQCLHVNKLVYIYIRCMDQILRLLCLHIQVIINYHSKYQQYMNNAQYVIHSHNQGVSVFCHYDYEKLVTAYYNHIEAPQEQIQTLQFELSSVDLKQSDKQLEKETFDLISNMNDGNTNKKYRNFNLCSFDDYLKKIEMHSQVNIHSFDYSYRNNNDTNNSGSVFDSTKHIWLSYTCH